MSLSAILLIIAIVCFVVAAFQERIGPVNPLAAGLAFMAGSFLV